MKRIFAFLAVGVLGTFLGVQGLSAQDRPGRPMPGAPAGTVTQLVPGMPLGTAIQRTNHGTVMQVHGGNPCCAPAPVCCEPAPCKVCVPKTEVKKVTTRYFDCACKDYCLPRCGHITLFRGLFNRHRCDDGCGDPCGGCGSGHGRGRHRDDGCGECVECDHVRTRNVLIIKKRVEDKCVTTCVVEHRAPTCVVPCPAPCPAPCVTPHHGGAVVVPHHPGQPMPKAEVIPPPK